ncbi:MAG: radical SAM protein [Pseudomonadota bacterium]
MSRTTQTTSPGSRMERRDYFSPEVRSVCPLCLRPLTAVVREGREGLVLEKTCPEHGMFRSTLAPDLESYRRLCRATRKVTRPQTFASEVKRGCPHDCGLCPAHDQHTCLAILEITSRCDLGCPVCLADSRPQGRDLTLAQVEHALRRAARCEGSLPALQIGGGEPTQHPALLEIVRLAASLGGERIELDSNGLTLTGDPELALRLSEAGLTGVYLQMDTLEPAASLVVRGRNLVPSKLAAIANCRRAGLEVVLSVTVVPGVNDQELWPLVRFAVERGLTGVNFQAVALSGRYPADLARGEKRLTSVHFRQEMARQSGGKLQEDDLLPIPCPDPRCGLLSYALVRGGELLPLNRLYAADQLVECLADLKDWPETIRHLEGQEACAGQCSCGVAKPQGLTAMLPGADFFAIGFHGMMDALSLDLDRAQRCCVHLLRPDGRLIPFCLYNTLHRPKSCSPPAAV